MDDSLVQLRNKLEAASKVLKELYSTIIEFQDDQNPLLREKISQYVSILADLDKMKSMYSSYNIPISAVKSLEDGKSISEVGKDILGELKGVNMEASRKISNIKEYRQQILNIMKIKYKSRTEEYLAFHGEE